MFDNKVAVILFVVLVCSINISTGKESEEVFLSGRIFDPNGVAVAGALVNILPNMENNSRQYMISISVDEAVRTDEAGRYEVRLGRNRFGPVQSEYFDMYVRSLDRNLMAVKKFRKDSKTVDVTLSTGIILTGRIVDVNDNPVPNASLSFMVPSATKTCIFNFEKNLPVSDKNGHYEIWALWPDKQYAVSANADGYGTTTITRYCIDDALDHRIEFEPFVLKMANMSVSGVVVDSEKKPVEGAQVSCFGDGQPSRTVKTDMEGRFILENICAGPVEINVRKMDREEMKYLSGHTGTEGGAADLEIIVSERDLSGRQGQKQPSLVDKPLPDVKDFGIAVSPADSENKILLICFFDYQQRPSRNCLVQLGKKVQELKGKGIIIIAVQAAKVEQDTLNEWCRENGITFPIGKIQNDNKQTCINWGVRSLPWLILTDTQHNVTAEGFSIDELNAKIEALGPSAGIPEDSNKVTGLVMGPDGQALSGVRVTEYQTDKDYITDAEGKFVSAFGPSEKRRTFFAVDKQNKLVGVGRLAAGGSHVEIKLTPAKMVSGTVVDPDGKSVAGAQVAPLPMTCYHVLTDEQGRFDLGWNPKWAGNLKEFFLMARCLERNLAAGVEIDGDTETVRIELEPAMALAGIVEDPNGVPVVGARVGLSLRRGWGCGTPVKQVVTDEKGRYEFPCLPQRQDYINYAEADGYWRNAITTGIINDIKQREQAGAIILKKPVMKVSGVVVDESGDPVAECPVGIRGQSQPQRSATTDAKGRFTIEKICSGQIEIWAKLSNLLYGTVESQAGRKDVKVIVTPIR